MMLQSHSVSSQAHVNKFADQHPTFFLQFLLSHVVWDLWWERDTRRWDPRRNPAEGKGNCHSASELQTRPVNTEQSIDHTGFSKNVGTLQVLAFLEWPSSDNTAHNAQISLKNTSFIIDTGAGVKPTSGYITNVS